jgi:hypothetical protein
MRVPAFPFENATENTVPFISIVSPTRRAAISGEIASALARLFSKTVPRNTPQKNKYVRDDIDFMKGVCLA